MSDLRAMKHHLRLWSGLVLFAYVTLHLINHMLGLWSLEVMERVQILRSTVTRSLPGQALLAAALVIHIGINLRDVVKKRAWTLRSWQTAQTVTGVLIPVFLFPHVVDMALPEYLWGVDVGYDYALPRLWPGDAWGKLVLLSLVWFHGCNGLRFWLFTKPFYQRWRPVLIGGAVAVPVFAALGIMVAGRFSVARGLPDWASEDRVEWLSMLKGSTQIYAGAAGLALAAVVLGLTILRRRHSRFQVTFEDGRQVPAALGQTLLEISKASGVAHAAICGGKGRCTTCRVAILAGRAHVDGAPLGEAENCVLACQSRLLGSVTLRRLVPPQAQSADLAVLNDPLRWGREEVLTVVFADLRGFTSFSEGLRPFDVVFALDGFMEQMTQIITAHGGHIDKFMGDGIMALFGIGQSPEQGARAAVRAAQDMCAAMPDIHRRLAWLDRPRFQIGVGLHTGPVVLGRIGGRSSAGARGHLTAIGDTVNTAARIEAQCKPLKAQILVSDVTYRCAGLGWRDHHSVALRGKSAMLRIWQSPAEDEDGARETKAKGREALVSD